MEHSSRRASPREMIARPRSRERIGELIRRRQELTDEQMKQILQHQREHDLQFGEAVVALGLARSSDVTAALSEQFYYPYASASGTRAGGTELVVCAEPFCDKAEAFRDLRMQLMADVMSEDSSCALAVVSPDVGDGKSYVAANLAACFSQLGGTTLLIDANMRTPRQRQLLGAPEADGLSTILSGHAEGHVVQPVEGIPGFYLLGAGPTPHNPLELLQSPRFSRLIHEVTGKFDHVLIDTPSNSLGADARLIASRAGAALVIGRKDHSSMAALASLVSRLGNASATVAGVVMNEH